MEPLTVRAVIGAPTVYSHCAHCETMFGAVGVGAAARRAMAEEYPADLVADYRRLCELLCRLAAEYAGRVRFEIVDSQSLGGVWLSFLHAIRRYPTFVVGSRGNKRKVVGWDEPGLEAAIVGALSARNPKLLDPSSLQGKGQRTS